MTVLPVARSQHAPPPRSPLIGREREIAAVRGLLVREDVQLVTLVGPGGVGKTRLAHQLAAALPQAFPDGVAVVSLEPIRSADIVLPAVAHALGIGESGQDNVIETLTNDLAAKRLLLVLDNIEQVIEVALDLARLLAGCPHVTLLVTSREPLRLRSERVVSVGPLPLPPTPAAATVDDIAASAAVQLFVERARAAQPAFDLTPANAWDIARICQRLDGLPLAIELAAARTKVLSPHALLTHLATPLPLLSGGPRDAPARQRTMRDAIAWSYDVLTPDEQAVFRRLGTFVGGFTLDGAITVVGTAVMSSVAVLDTVTSLVDRSLLAPMTDGPEPRFTMLETIREFAVEQLVSAGEAEAARRAHASYFRDLAEQAEPALRGAGQPVWIARLEVELPNLRAVLDWSLDGGDVETGLRLAGALYWFWFLRNHVTEGRAWFERARSAGSHPAAAAGRAAAGAALLAWRAAEYEASKAYSEDALALFASCADEWGTAMIVHHLGHIADDLDHDGERAITLLSDSLEQFTALGDRWGVAYSQRCLAYMFAEHHRDYHRATPLLNAAAETFREIGDRWNLGVTLHMLADNARERQQWSAAIPFYQESLTNHWEERDALGVADALLRLAQIQVALGEMEMALRLFGCAEAQHERAGVRIREPIRAGSEQMIDAARAALGAERFSLVWQTGRSLSLAEAVTLALALEPRSEREDRRATQLTPSRGSSLSARERDVLRLLVDGRSDREIAEALSIGVRTVHTHVAAILNKIGVSSRTAAATRAVRDGLI